MTCIVNPKAFPTKKSLRERAQEINEGRSSGEIWIEDPSIVPARYFPSAEIQEGQEEVVTNHPKRSWFAQIGRKGGKLYVK